MWFSQSRDSWKATITSLIWSSQLDHTHDLDLGSLSNPSWQILSSSTNLDGRHLNWRLQVSHRSSVGWTSVFLLDHTSTVRDLSWSHDSVVLTICFMSMSWSTHSLKDPSVFRCVHASLNCEGKWVFLDCRKSPGGQKFLTFHTYCQKVKALEMVLTDLCQF